jgi:hypothetical protein
LALLIKEFNQPGRKRKSNILLDNLLDNEKEGEGKITDSKTKSDKIVNNNNNNNNHSEKVVGEQSNNKKRAVSHEEGEEILEKLLLLNNKKKEIAEEEIIDTIDSIDTIDNIDDIIDDDLESDDEKIDSDILEMRREKEEKDEVIDKELKLVLRDETYGCAILDNHNKSNNFFSKRFNYDSGLNSKGKSPSSAKSGMIHVCYYIMSMLSYDIINLHLLLNLECIILVYINIILVFFEKYNRQTRKINVKIKKNMFWRYFAFPS